MMIKDLEMTHELAREELSAVPSGSSFGFLGGQQVDQAVAGGGIFGPTFVGR
jgi:hypothetical protein